MKLLNLGCGSKYHRDWINIDFASTNKGVIAYNLLKGIPYNSNTIDVVYHSHLLEHFSKQEASDFIKECYRVLKPLGIIRVVAPDLEVIVDNYQKYLRLALKGNKNAEANYEWTMLELYDQCVRTINGGEMGKVYSTGNISNSDFVYKRTGIKIRKKLHSSPIISPFRMDIKNWILKNILGKEFEYYKLGKFRLSGEVHQWMYDRFSLKKLLVQNKFIEVKICQVMESRVPNWNLYNLDTNSDGTVCKPDSIFIEAVK